MVNFSSCDRHQDCLIVFDNIHGCPVCEMVKKVESAIGRKGSAKEKIEEIKEALI